MFQWLFEMNVTTREHTAEAQRVRRKMVLIKKHFRLCELSVSAVKS